MIKRLEIGLATGARFTAKPVGNAARRQYGALAQPLPIWERFIAWLFADV